MDQCIRYLCGVKMFDIIESIKYAWLTAKHKWFVLIIGLKIGVPLIRLLKHDISKYSFKELPHYGRQFFGDKSDMCGFIKAWIHHQNHNDHHWEYWIPRTGHNKCTLQHQDNVPVEMPKEAALEMIADWFGAGRAYEGKWPGSDWPWLNKNFNKIIIHENTRKYVIEVLRSLNINIGE